MMYSAYKWNKQGDNIQPWYTPFPAWNQSILPWPALTVASWPAYWFLRSRSGGLVFPSLEQFSTVCCDLHKGFSIINKTEVDFFPWNFLVFSMIQWVLAIWSLVPLPFLSPAWTSGSSQFTYCWRLAWRIFSITSKFWEFLAIQSGENISMWKKKNIDSSWFFFYFTDWIYNAWWIYSHNITRKLFFHLWKMHNHQKLL